MFPHFYSYNAETLNKNGKEQLMKSVEDIGDWTDNSLSFYLSFLRNIFTLIGKGVNAIISISVQPDPYDPNTQVLTVCILFFDSTNGS